tara:strand:- start:10313 stop:12016 length:1704 start_codon:yes stop_codon:yes gene_type:complete
MKKNKNINKLEIDKNFKYLCVSHNSPISMAMKIIDRGKERLCFVVDSNQKLRKVVSDGDIRRALINGKKISDKVDTIHNRQPVLARDTHPELALQKLSKSVMLMPVVNIKNEIVGVIRLNDFPNAYNIRNRNIAVIGLGYVGLTLSLVLAENEFSVVGVDKNKDLIKKLVNKKPPFYENGLENLLLAQVNNFFKPTISVEDVHADIYIITVGTPINSSTKKPNINHIKKAILVIAKKLKKNDLVILRSTVPIGLSRNYVIPLLEKESKLKAGDDFFVSFCPERTSEGRALKELRELPQIVGGFDHNSRQMSMRFFNEITHTVIDVGSLEASEMCKLIDNTYRDTIFAYSNQMATLTEKLGLNLNDLLSKVNLGYERNRIPLPSPGVGGPCLSKDPYILKESFHSFNLKCPITISSRNINESAPRLIYNRSKNMLSKVGKNIKKEKIFIIGFAFKGEPVTSDLRDSTTIWFLNYLKSKGVKNIFGYDPVVDINDIEKLGVTYCKIEQGFKNSAAVFFMNNHRSYSNLNIYKLLNSMNKPAIFYDGWNMFLDKEINKNPGIIYSGIGVG